MSIGETLTALSPTYIWAWTLLAVVMTWTVLRVATKKKNTEVTETETETETEKGDGADVIIVGAGVAGSALAYVLAKDGRRVHVIERDLSEPDRMMGEVMQPGGRLMLAELGLEECLEEIDSQKMRALAIYKDGKCGHCPFPEDFEFPYEACGRGFHNGRFVQRLRHKASSLPNVNLEEGTVKSLVEEKGLIKGVKYKSKSTGQETTAFAPLTVVCDGAYSNLRRSLHDPKVEVNSYIIGYVTKNCRLKDPESLHLIMSEPSFSMLYQIGSDEVRCLAEVLPENVPSIANGEVLAFFKKVISPQIPPKLRDIFLKGLDENPEIKTVATKSMGDSLCDKNGVIVLGDAFNMRHPIVASGMMVALSDVVILRDLLKPLNNLGDAKKLSRTLKSFHNLRKPMSATVNTLADAFHRVLLASNDEAREAMRQGSFNYLCRGGFSTKGLMAILGGMNPRPPSLVLHLFGITFASILTLLSPFPTPRGIWNTLRLLRLALTMLGTHLKEEGVNQMLSPTIATAYRKRYMAATTA
ncbi:PREDICTED: squalene monooxygenase 1,1-like [Tarenaya hassleriana]|uniref:squalene monooxygenase 1,1-like n=1 Tax=Tarenaya hassleriana TaxID=28532 RepID=UPI00053C351F|nr:PREDICTED: squalene monooxygenase 1,1-like [Tarenaya hassleriana]